MKPEIKEIVNKINRLSLEDQIEVLDSVESKVKSKINYYSIWLPRLLRAVFNDDLKIKKDVKVFEIGIIIEKILKILSWQEKSVIEKRYGIGTTGIVYFQKDIGKDLDVSASRISQIEKTALQKMRQSNYLKRLELFLEDKR